MSDDLISRKVLMERVLQEEYDNDIHKDGRAKAIHHGEYQHFCKTIAETPTAYDTGKVAETINEIGQRYCNSVKCDKNCDDCEHGCLMRAITSAVKSGGVADD